MKKSFALAAAITLSSTGLAAAGSTVVQSTPQGPVIETTHGDWKFRAGLYVWGAGLDGTIGAAGGSADIDLSFSDILDTLDMTFMGLVEAQKGRLIFQLEGFYLKNSVKVPAMTPGGATGSAKLVAETTRLTPVIGYRVFDNDLTQFDLLAGAVYFDISNDLSFFAAGPAAGFVDTGDDWWDPMIGMRVTHRLTEKWYANLRADVGGFGVNADINWQALALLGYELNDTATLFGGWRHAAVDYTNGLFTYDVSNTGPIIGVVFDW